MEDRAQSQRPSPGGQSDPRDSAGGEPHSPPPPRLYLNHSASQDWLIALEFGRVDDGQPPESWRPLSDSFAYLHDGPGGRCLGFKALGLSELDPEDPALAGIWEGPRFDAPQLGLTDVPAGEVALAARAFFDGADSLNRRYFELACERRGDEALDLWQSCLEAGDAMAHFALGYTLHDLGRHREAYRHLRHYAEIAPAGSWNWCWFGKAAEAVGEVEEARAAYRRAIELELRGEQETDAEELLDRLEGRS